MKYILVSFFLLVISVVSAQNVGIGTNNPQTKLDVAGAITHEEPSTPLAAVNGSNTIPSGYSQIRVTAGTGLNAAFTLTAPSSATTGQVLAIYNTSGYTATFGTTSIPTGTAIEFIYSNSTWVATSPGGSSANYIQNQTSTTQTAGFNISGNALIGGSAGIGNNSPNSAAILDLSNTQSKGFLPPVLTTVQRNSISSPPQGLTVYNTSTLCLETYIGSSWQPIGCGCSSAPSAPGSITAPSSTICQGYNGFTFSCPPVAGASTYNWTLPTGASIASGSGTSNITANFSSTAATGAQTVSVSATNSCGTSSSTNTSITINSIPQITSNPSNSTICAYNSGTNNGNTSFSVGATGTGISYQWQVNSGSGWSNVSNGGIYSGATTSTLSLMAATVAYNGYQYQCVVSGTCTPSATSSAATLTVNATPTISGTLSVCVGATVTLTGSGSPAASSPWTSSNTSYATVTSGGVVTGVATGLSPVITYTNSNGCAAQATMTINGLPTATASASSTTVCIGSTLSLTGGASGMTSYSWSGPNSFTSSSQSPTVSSSATAAMAGVYTIKVTNSYGCTASASTSSVSVGYGTNVIDNSSSQYNSISANAKGEIIIMDIGGYTSNFGGNPPTVNGSSSGVYYLPGSGTGTNSNMTHYTFAYVTTTTTSTPYTLGGGAGGYSGYWAQTNISIKNTYGCQLTLGTMSNGSLGTGNNIHQGSGYSYNATTGSGSVNTSTSVPVGALLVGTAYDDGGSCGTASWGCSPQSGFTSGGSQSQCDSDGDNDMIGGVTITSANSQTVTCTNSGQNGGGFMMNVFWVQYP